MGSDKIYLVWSEGKTDWGMAETWFGANALALWIGLWTWFRLDPQRMCIGEVRRSEYDRLMIQQRKAERK